MGLVSCSAENQDLLELLGIPRLLLPEIRSSSKVSGEAIGDLSAMPVAGVLGDQPASLFVRSHLLRPP